MFYYIPQPDQATISIQTIARLVPYGVLIRNLHYWGAQALVLEWAVLHRAELRQAWELASRNQEPSKIPPLD